MAHRRPSSRRRDRDQMSMVWHQAIAPNRHPLFAAPLGHQFQVGRVVSVVEERLLSAVAPLGNVVGHAGYDQSRQSCHAQNITDSSIRVNNSSCVSRIKDLSKNDSVIWSNLPSPPAPLPRTERGVVCRQKLRITYFGSGNYPLRLLARTYPIPGNNCSLMKGRKRGTNAGRNKPGRNGKKTG